MVGSKIGFMRSVGFSKRGKYKRYENIVVRNNKCFELIETPGEDWSKNPYPTDSTSVTLVVTDISDTTVYPIKALVEDYVTDYLLGNYIPKDGLPNRVSFGRAGCYPVNSDGSIVAVSINYNTRDHMSAILFIDLKSFSIIEDIKSGNFMIIVDLIIDPESNSGGFTLVTEIGLCYDEKTRKSYHYGYGPIDPYPMECIEPNKTQRIPDKGDYRGLYRDDSSLGNSFSDKLYILNNVTGDLFNNKGLYLGNLYRNKEYWDSDGSAVKSFRHLYRVYPSKNVLFLVKVPTNDTTDIACLKYSDLK